MKHSIDSVVLIPRCDSPRQLDDWSSGAESRSGHRIYRVKGLDIDCCVMKGEVTSEF